MKRIEHNSERLAGLVLCAWLLLHSLLLEETGVMTFLTILVLLAGFVCRLSAVFPPLLFERIILPGLVLGAGFFMTFSVGVAGALAGLTGASLLLRPVSPARGLWILLCCIIVLAGITLQDTGKLGTVFLIIDVAVLMLIAQQIHTPREAEVNVWESVLQSLRLVVPVALVVTVVFWIFPAISSRTNVVFMGFGGGDQLNPGGASELRWTRRMAFVAAFVESSAVPPASDLYWRGQVLESNEGLRWFRDPERINPGTESHLSTSSAETWTYRQRLAPDRPLAALDRPFSVTPLGDDQHTTILQTGGAVFSALGIGSVLLEIVATSAPPDDPPVAGIAGGDLKVPEKARTSPRLVELASKLFDPSKSFSQKLDSLGGYFGSGGFVYTLSPGKMPSDDVVGFLFFQKKGFCEHYAAAAANLLRMGGIPARVVTGFRGGGWNPWLRTISVHDSDAHAWVEAWDETSRHWIRFDPTNYVAPGLSEHIEFERDSKSWPWYRTATTYASALFSRAGSKLESFLTSHPIPSQWVMILLLTVLVAAWIFLRKSARRDKPDVAAASLAVLEFQAARFQKTREPGETPLAWIARLELTSADGSDVRDLKAFAAEYESTVYAAAHRSSESMAAMSHSAERLVRIWRRTGK